MLSAFCALVEAAYSATIEKADNIPHAAIFLCTVFSLDPIFVLSALAFSARAKSSKNIFFFVTFGCFFTFGTTFFATYAVFLCALCG